MSETKDQQHPQERVDRPIVDRLLAAEEPDDFALAELARLLVRYDGFPGARSIQADLQTVMARWQLTENTLFEKTREIHARGPLYQVGGRNKGIADWGYEISSEN